jgi:beta-phosphoglucomutase
LNEKTDILFGIENQINDETVLFFDLDGTLVNTDLVNFNAYKEAIQNILKSKIDLDFNPGKRFNRNLLWELMPQLTEAQFEQIVTEKETSFEKHLRDTTTNSRVIELLKVYNNTNKIVLVTNCRENRALITLKYHGLADCFNHKFFKQTNNANNHVNKYMFALKTLRLSPKNIVVIENERCEIEDAIIAGIEENNVFIFEI